MLDMSYHYLIKSSSIIKKLLTSVNNNGILKVEGR